MLLRALSSWFLKSSKNGDSTTSLDNLTLKIHDVFFFFSYPVWNSIVSIYAHYLLLFCLGSLRAFCSPGYRSPASLPGESAAAPWLFWMSTDLIPVDQHLSCIGGQMWYFRCSLMNAKRDNHLAQSTCTAPIHALREAASLCCQATPLAYVQLAVCQDAQVFFSEVALQPESNLYSCMGFFCCRCRTLHVSLWILGRYPVVHSSRLTRSLWVAAMALRILTGSPSLPVNFM